MPRCGGRRRAHRCGTWGVEAEGHEADRIGGRTARPPARPGRGEVCSMSPSARRSLGRLVRELGRGETRPRAIRRIRRGVGAWVAGPSAPAKRVAPAAPRQAAVPTSAGATRPGARRPAWYVGAWGRLAGAVAGKDPLLDPTPPDPSAGPSLLRDARLHRGARRPRRRAVRASPPCRRGVPRGERPRGGAGAPRRVVARRGRRPAAGCGARPPRRVTRCSCIGVASSCGPGTSCATSTMTSSARPSRSRPSTPPSPSTNRVPATGRWR